MITYSSARWIVFSFFLLVILALIILVPLSYVDVNTNFEYVTHTWKTDPIVSIYVPTSYQGNTCNPNYEAVSVSGSLKAISEGPCGCVENELGFESGNASCSVSSRKSNMCMTLKSQPQVASSTWRNSIICIQRGGQAAATNYEKYDARPHPNKKGACPANYKKCGEGFNQQGGAICFPIDVDCPITNLLVLPSGKAPPLNALWETAGTFPNNNHTLFVRREYSHELPIIDVAFSLAQINSKNENVRGVCFKGPLQVVNSSAFADPTKLWSYQVALPPVCDITDSRFVLVDQMPLQDHFLQNLQLTEPVCAEFTLYPLSDPRYQQALDPDYLNSGVKCDFNSKYTCVRDPYQRTDCATKDSICDGVMNQNICGEYTHAVRAAFPENSEVTMGMYIQREVQWTDGCDASKAGVYHAHYMFYSATAFAIATPVLWGVYNLLVLLCDNWPTRYRYDIDAAALLVLGLGMQLMYILKVTHLYESLDNGDCTDSFTKDTMMDRLEPVYTSMAYIVTFMGVSFILFVDAAIMTYWCHKYDPPPRTHRRRRHREPRTTTHQQTPSTPQRNPLVPYQNDRPALAVPADRGTTTPGVNAMAYLVDRTASAQPSPRSQGFAAGIPGVMGASLG